jgi:hypothetical protein
LGFLLNRARRHIHGHHKPSGQARVRIDGKDHDLGPFGSPESKANYDLLVRKHLTDQAKADVEARVQISNDLTINVLIAANLRHAKTYYLKNDRKNTNTVSTP